MPTSIPWLSWWTCPTPGTQKWSLQGPNPQSTDGWEGWRHLRPRAPMQWLSPGCWLLLPADSWGGSPGCGSSIRISLKEPLMTVVGLRATAGLPKTPLSWALDIRSPLKKVLIWEHFGFQILGLMMLNLYWLQVLRPQIEDPFFWINLKWDFFFKQFTKLLQSMRDCKAKRKMQSLRARRPGRHTLAVRYPECDLVLEIPSA